MALCLASSLVIRRDFIPYDQLVRYKWWFKNGYMSSTGECFDIGAATKRSLLEFERRQRGFAHKYNIPPDEIDSVSNPQLLREFNVDCSEKGVAGNGALMRLTPVPLFFHRHHKHAVEFSGVSGRITHGGRSAYDACRYYGALIVAAVKGADRTELLDNDFYSNHKEWFDDEPLHKDILEIAQGSYKKKGGYKEGIRGKGYIVSALEAALWAFWFHKDSFEEGALAAVNLGDDADTTAAIYGQLAGAYFGFKNLPKKWLAHLYAAKFIRCLSKWIIYEGERWNPDESLALMIPESTSPPKSDSITGSSTKQTPNVGAQSPTSQPKSYNSAETPSENREGSKPTSESAGQKRSEARYNDKTQVNAKYTSYGNTTTNPNVQPASRSPKGSNSGHDPKKSPGSNHPEIPNSPGYNLDTLKTCQAVCHWLGNLDKELAAYVPNFEDNIVDGFWLLNHVNEKALSQYGVTNANHRKKILRHIEELKNKCSKGTSTKKK